MKQSNEDKTMTGKVNVRKIVRSVSRQAFSDIPTVTKVIPSKTRYTRKSKHKNRHDW